MAMPIKARCGRADEIPPGSSKVVQIREHMVAIFNVAGTLHAIDNTCPHQGGPLGEGYLEDDAVVSCRGTAGPSACAPVCRRSSRK